jgi:hypothetical protein
MGVLRQTEKLREELAATRPLPVEAEQRIMQKFRLDWNFHSNYLEGNSLTYGETKALLLLPVTARTTTTTSWVSLRVGGAGVFHAPVSVSVSGADRRRV